MAGNLAEEEFEVNRITDVRSGRRTRYDRVHRKFKVYWNGYGDPSWVDRADLNCVALVQDWNHDRVKKKRVRVMQSHEEIYMRVSNGHVVDIGDVQKGCIGG